MNNSVQNDVIVDNIEIDNPVDAQNLNDIP
jgi:hypothetical protein